MFWIIKDSPDDVEDQADFDLLEERFLRNPELALTQVGTVMNGMARKAQKNVMRAFDLMENYSVEYTAQKLKELCQRAGKYIIGVEPMPYSGIPDLKKGWEVVKASGCENAMLILDTWHWVRANQPYDILTPEIAKKVISIQINDAYERPYADSILRDESMHDRLAPGTGAKDTAGFVKMIKDAGIDPKVVGVEVISDEILGRGINEAAAYTYENTEKVLKEAWPELVD